MGWSHVICGHATRHHMKRDAPLHSTHLVDSVVCLWYATGRFLKTALTGCPPLSAIARPTGQSYNSLRTPTARVACTRRHRVRSAAGHSTLLPRVVCSSSRIRSDHVATGWPPPARASHHSLVQWPFASPTGTSVPEGELLEPRTSALARSRRGAADGDDTLFALTDRFLSAAATTNDVAATSYVLPW